MIFFVTILLWLYWRVSLLLVYTCRNIGRATLFQMIKHNFDGWWIEILNLTGWCTNVHCVLPFPFLCTWTCSYYDTRKKKSCINTCQQRGFHSRFFTWNRLMVGRTVSWPFFPEGGVVTFPLCQDEASWWGCWWAVATPIRQTQRRRT